MFIVCLILLNAEVMAESFTDPRDGKTYKITKIGQQIWMAENLDYNMKGSYYCSRQGNKCGQGYGRQYTGEDAQNACPKGWHLPSEQEFETLLKNAGNTKRDAATKLKDRSSGHAGPVYAKTHYIDKCVKYACSYGYYGETIRDCQGNSQCNCGDGKSICLEYKKVKGATEYIDFNSQGSNETGFSAIDVRYYDKNDMFCGEGTFLWSSTKEVITSRGSYYEEVTHTYYKALKIGVDEADIMREYSDYGLSVRCLKD